MAGRPAPTDVDEFALDLRRAFFSFLSGCCPLGLGWALFTCRDSRSLRAKRRGHSLHA